jgi:hypothetical protein
MPAAEFLALMKGIFSREESAKAAIKSIIDEIRQEIQDWELGNAIGFDTEEEPGYGNYSPAEPETEVSDDDYANMSTRELDAAIDAALDARDYDLVAKISKYRD